MIDNCRVFMAVFKRTLFKVGKYRISDLKSFTKEDMVKAARNAMMAKANLVMCVLIAKPPSENARRPALQDILPTPTLE